MTIEKFFEALAANPMANATCSQFRAIDGVWFMKSDGNWRTVGVVEDGVVMTSDQLRSYHAGRNAFEISNWRNQLLNSGVFKENINIVFNGLGAELPPNRRKIPDRYGLIGETLVSAIGFSGPADKFDDWWDACWSYMMCCAANKLLEARSSASSTITQVATNDAAELSRMVGVLQERASKELFDRETIDMMVQMQTKSTNLSSKAYNAVSRIQTAESQACQMAFPYSECVTSEATHRSYVFSLHFQPFKVMIPAAMVETGNGFIGTLPALRRLFRRIGMPLPYPFGMDLTNSTVSRLGVLADNTKQLVMEPKLVFGDPDTSAATTAGPHELA